MKMRYAVREQTITQAESRMKVRNTLSLQWNQNHTSVQEEREKITAKLNEFEVSDTCDPSSETFI